MVILLFLKPLTQYTFKDQGVAYTFGRNDKGQLGDGNTTCRDDPFAIEGLD